MMAHRISFCTLNGSLNQLGILCVFWKEAGEGEKNSNSTLWIMAFNIACNLEIEVLEVHSEERDFKAQYEKKYN